MNKNAKQVKRTQNKELNFKAFHELTLYSGKYNITVEIVVRSPWIKLWSECSVTRWIDYLFVQFLAFNNN